MSVPARYPHRRTRGHVDAARQVPVLSPACHHRSARVCSTGNSVLRENNAHFAALAPTKTVMRTLDELIDSYTSSHPGTPAAGQRKILLKLDVQGYEINVLKGAKRLLQDVEVMLLETSVLQYNKGSPLTGEVLTYLESIGFQVLDVLELHHGGPSNMLLQIDFAFIKKGSPLIQSANLGAGIKE